MNTEHKTTTIQVYVDDVQWLRELFGRYKNDAERMAQLKDEYEQLIGADQPVKDYLASLPEKED